MFWTSDINIKAQTKQSFYYRYYTSGNNIFINFCKYIHRKQPDYKTNTRGS